MWEADPTRAENAESVRVQRLLLATLNAAPDVVEWMMEDVRDCSYCLGRVAARLLATSATHLAMLAGGAEPAMQALQNQLLIDMA
ncbi:hypothetical protein MPUL_34460 [Mycolicibacterium pulveris]|uniref:Uncharacterized protein n=1 Tax=Mycolicibacterium pulveris TaxID=36813 RepID=A0A7I7ULF8_MYCPV|nr:hypothetical protein MPUL_34460 [Mycolicibacterium pulveris]